MHHHVAILTEPWTAPLKFDSLPWRGWSNARPDSREEGRRMSVHRWLRESGYLNPGVTVPRLTLHVYDWHSTDPCHPDGTPMAITYTTFALSPRS